VYALIRTFCANQRALPRRRRVRVRLPGRRGARARRLNPQIAARLARSFDRWKKFDAIRRQHARQALEQIRDHPGLSKDTTEVVTRALD
jgi:aminopeptidase N